MLPLGLLPLTGLPGKELLATVRYPKFTVSGLSSYRKMSANAFFRVKPGYEHRVSASYPPTITLLAFVAYNLG